MRHFFLVTAVLVFFPFPGKGQSVPSFLSQLKNQKEFDQLAGEPLSAKFGQVDAVKVVYVLRTKKLYFIHSTRFKYHYDFCRDYLGDQQDLYRYNYNNYSNSTGRKYYLCNVNHFKSSGRYVIEFSPADLIRTEDIEILYRAIKENFFAGDSLKVYMNTTRLIDDAKKKNTGFPIVFPAEIYGKQQLQVISSKKAEGTLLKVTGAEVEKLGDCSDKILLIKGGSNYIPFCAGIITTDFQTPLSHISILARNRKIPVVAWKNAWENGELEKLKGKFISLEVNADTFFVKELPRPLPDSAGKEIKYKKLDCDTSTSVIADISQIKYKSIKTYGAKASNLGELNRVMSIESPIHIPEGAFSIPFYWYAQHVRKYGIDKMIIKACSPEVKKDRPQLEKLLAGIRDSIMKSPANPHFIKVVEEKVLSKNAGNQFRFRSSSNAEDLQGFNGAGLYDSKTGIPGDTAKTVERAIKTVWASLWNMRAFDEREHFHIDQLSIAMGVLCHRAFPDELVNGVAITKNIYRDYEAGYIINAQLGEVSVVAPPDTVTCDQLISFLNTDSDFFNTKNAIEYLSFSSLSKGVHVLSDEEIQQLTKQLSAIKKHFYSKTGASLKYVFKEYALDVEFKIYKDEKGNRKLYIKQCRPFY